jgi:hypothetical protein
VNDAVKRLNSPKASGAVGNVREEEPFIQTLRSLAPVDHVVFSGVDKIIRGKLEDLNLDDAKYLFVSQVPERCSLPRIRGEFYILI